MKVTRRYKRLSNRFEILSKEIRILEDAYNYVIKDNPMSKAASAINKATITMLQRRMKVSKKLAEEIRKQLSDGS